MDFPRMSELWFDRPDDTPPRYTHVSVRLRGPRGSHREQDVPEAADNGNTADGTACMPQVGQPRLVGVITLSRERKSQRGAYEPASCLRGSVVDTPSARKPSRLRRGGCQWSNSWPNSFRWAVRMCCVIVVREMLNFAASSVALMPRGCSK